MEGQAIPYGFCRCGCGQKTKLVSQARSSRNLKAGEPQGYIIGHRAKTQYMETPPEFEQKPADLVRKCKNGHELIGDNSRTQPKTGRVWCQTCTTQRPCRNGHPYSAENIRMTPGGTKRCVLCERKNGKRYRKHSGGNKKRLERRRLDKYGLTQSDIDAMVLEQNNRCAACKKPFSDSYVYAPVVDHCHISGKVRGILHRICNSAIGMLGDDPRVCELAAVYLWVHEGKKEAQLA